MSTSSIHFQRADYTFAEKHNSRQTERQPSYLLPEDKRQQNDFIKLEDVKTLHEKQMEYRRLTHARGSSPTLTDSYWEAVVNLNSEHTIDDVRRVAEHIRQKFKFTPTSIAIHRDEGYVDKVTGETKYNYHGHLTFYTIENGRSQMRLMTRAKLRDLQTEVANSLGMQRGQEHSKAKRLDHQQYREVKRTEEKTQEELVKTQKELNELKSTIRQEMISQGGFSAQDYRSLNQLISDYKNVFKLGETVTVSEVVKDIYRRLNNGMKVKAENDRLTLENDTLKTENADLRRQLFQKSSETPQKRSQSDEKTLERVTLHDNTQNLSMSEFEASQPEEKRYNVKICSRLCDLRAEDIHDWLKDYPGDKDSIAKQLSEADRREVFGEPKQTPSRVRHGFHR